MQKTNGLDLRHHFLHILPVTLPWVQPVQKHWVLFLVTAYGMTDYCHQGRAEFNGTPRTFGSFFEMAQENAWSRVPLGVHWRMDCEEGVRFGTEIAQKDEFQNSLERIDYTVEFNKINHQATVLPVACFFIPCRRIDDNR
jgi:hypothetical protein